MQTQRSLQRVNYFEGQLLTASDFQAEQTYFREKLRRHNRYLHGWGIAWGLRVTLNKDNHSVIISAGCALDCMGNELILPEQVAEPIPAQGKEWYLALEYMEEAVQPVLVPGSDGSAQAFSRIKEWAAVVWLPDRPSHSGGPGPAPFDTCGAAHAVLLAHLIRRKRRWEIHKTYQPQKAYRKRNSDNG
ncbi:MAG: hypothetical protein ACK2UW_19590 [Anaerolineales bacterium]|jgi:hypothetical protein